MCVRFLVQASAFYIHSSFYNVYNGSHRIGSVYSVHGMLLHLVNNEQANKINHDNNDVEMLAKLYLRLYAMASGLFRIGYLMTQPVRPFIAMDRIA